mmetsp:Transcript_65795/g.157225  ORF Transcript_65795/g.157225 Transcript_65795/m.157225 type:complete len:737 (-) Transcript_65795:223-2433(-)|eukprot:CAMPEP_0178404186 /NCGR_PEP_ID=MMETSP0689_2-20121128/17750_1 /TAXON_ID=160604 /ORGANISM="Amphidinium massartii, Strain CS-259" /LENGTH=736 /DNA_ID=CAMNT_0020025155 /DNA_START=75 /DNA_END=2285 /DNA_ORIENTATION=+
MPFVKQTNLGAVVQDKDKNKRGRDGSLALQKPMPRADVVIVFPYKVHAGLSYGEASNEESQRRLKPPSPEEKHKMDTWALTRQGVIQALDTSGLVLMPFYSRDRDEIFLKVAIDEEHLKAVAETKQHKLELKPEYLSAFAEFKNDYVGTREVGYSDRRVVSHLFQLHDELLEDQEEEEGPKYPRPDAIFRAVDRVQIIDYVIRNSGLNCAGVDIGQLMHDGDVLHYFPLHENDKLTILDNHWFDTFTWGRRIHEVRDYFGEKVAMYFLFMAHLNKWLVLPAIVCLGLQVWAWIYGTPDNYSLFFVVFFMGIWQVLFVHFWRRTAATYAIKWGTYGLGQMTEPTRPQFTGVSRINPVTGRVDRYYPWSKRILTVMCSYTVLVFAIGMLGFVVAMLFFLRHYMHDNFPGRGNRYLFQFINALMVELLNYLFTLVAKWLTDRENHRAESEYSSHLLAKTVVFKFVNSYISLYYIAFFKDRSSFFGEPMSCMKDDCMKDAGSQLCIFMVVRLTILNAAEFLLPQMRTWYRSYSEGRQFNTGLFSSALTVMPDMSTAEKQSKKEDVNLFEDMDEVLIGYGYCTLFVSVAPWVTTLALVANVIECFLDQKKLVFLFRRNFPLPAANNEPWDTAFDVFSHIALLTNLAVVVFSSHAFDEWSYTYRLLILVVGEHVLLLIRVAVGIIAPATPRQVRLLQLQQRVVVHRHIDLGGEEDDHDTRTSAMRSANLPPVVIYDRDDDDE